MELKRLVTLTFDRNVGTADRVFRLLSGVGVMAAGWYFALPLWVSSALAMLGFMWLITGVLSKCSIYYMMGYSTCPVRGRSS